MQKMRIDSTQVAGKRVFIRVDFNVPMEGGVISDDRRIKASLATIRSVLDRGGRVVLASHLGRPKGKGFEAEYSLAPVARRLAELLATNAPHGVGFPSNDCTDLDARTAVLEMPDRGVILLENLRFATGEKNGDAAFADTLAGMCDVYVNDAFGTSHRADASMYALPMSMRARGKPCVSGFLLAAELEYLITRIAAAQRPFTAILGGAKVSDKIMAIENLMAKVDRLVIGGAMAYTFLRAQGVATGNSLVEADKIDLAREILAKAKAKGCEILLPTDHACGRAFKAGTESMTSVGGRLARDLPRRLARRRLWCGTDRWACLRCRRSMKEPALLLTRSSRRRLQERSQLLAAATLRLRLNSLDWRTNFPMSQRAAARALRCSKASILCALMRWTMRRSVDDHDWT